jgi:hypothetical protein
MQEKIIQKGNTFQTYKQLIQDVLTKTYKDVINLMSQEALNYIIKELYSYVFYRKIFLQRFWDKGNYRFP